MIEPAFKIKEEKGTEDFAQFVIEPLEPGYGHTIGNALRRVLLTSIPGAAVTAVKVSGVKHRFSTVPGLKEHVVDLLLNLKGLNFRLLDGEEATISFSVKGPKEITGKDVDLPSNVELLNKDHYIGSLSDKKAKLDIELTIQKGYGYALAEEKKAESLGLIPTDATFSPVKRVNYEVTATRVGRQTNLDKLVLSVWTNGTITPTEALTQASKILTSYFMQVYEPKASGGSESISGSSVSSVSDDLLKLTIDELDLPTRIYNSLRNGGIETIGDLLTTSKKELMSMRNMGGKSISIIDEKLQEKGISLNI